MRKPVLLILILIIIVVTLSIVRIYVSNNIATSGVILGKLQEKIGKLQTENAVLSQNVYENSSLNFIASKAAELGFINNKTTFVINSQLRVASKQ